MTRYDRLLKNGYKVIIIMGRKKGQEGYCHAKKSNIKIRGKSESDLHKQIFGY